MTEGATPVECLGGCGKRPPMAEKWEGKWTCPDCLEDEDDG